LLSRREFSSAELHSRLAGQGFDAQLLEALVTELREERLLDDARYATLFVRSHAERGQGPRRIRSELKQAGLDEATIARALDSAPDFHALARELRARRFGADVPVDWPERARQSRFLQYRGFSNDHIASALGSSGADASLPDDDP
jgi:regulatory protein